MRTAIFITIRMDSSRLPAKTMRAILGKPVLEHIVQRAKLAGELMREVLRIRPTTMFSIAHAVRISTGIL